MHRESATKALFRGGKLHIMTVQKIERNAERILFTPGYISVSSKHVFSVSDDGNRVPFPITPAVKGSASPAMSGGAVTQHPLRVASNSRSQELIKATFVKCFVH